MFGFQPVPEASGTSQVFINGYNDAWTNSKVQKSYFSFSYNSSKKIINDKKTIQYSTPGSIETSNYNTGVQWKK